MAQTKFSGPVKSDNGFTGDVDTLGGELKHETPTAATTAANFAASNYITIVGQDGNTYYVPVASAAW